MSRYPHLQFRRHWSLTEFVQYGLGQCDGIVRAIGNTPVLPEHYSHLLEVSLVKGAQATTAIEGNTLTEEEVELVAEGASLPPSKEYQEIEVRNVLTAMNELRRELIQDENISKISPELLLRFHRLIGKDLGEHFDAIPGRFASHRRVVGPYRAPAHEDVPELVRRLSHWLAEEFGYPSQSFADAIVQAVITHVYIEWIHPFDDGNGRVGRLVEFYILMRAGMPDVASHILSNFYNETRPEYYRQLDRAGRTGDLTKFLEYAMLGLRDGLLAVLRTINDSQAEITWRELIYDRFAKRKYHKRTVFMRRRRLMLHFPTDTSLTLEEIPDANPEIARSYADLTLRTLQRDLSELEGLELISREGGRYRARTDLLRRQLPGRIRSGPAAF